GARASAVGVAPVNARTSRWRWDWSAYPLSAATREALSPAANWWAAWSNRTRRAAPLGDRPIWERNRDPRRLRLHPVSVASSSALARPRLAMMRFHARATAGSTDGPAS